MAKLGRKSKYSKELIERICSYIESGADNEDAFVQAGISKTTAYKWLDETDKDNPLTQEQIQDFRERMDTATARRNTVLSHRIIQASEPTYLRDMDNNLVTDKDGRPIVFKSGDWRAAAWYLERTQPERYAHREKLEHTGRLDIQEIPEEVKDAFRKTFKEIIRGRKPKDIEADI